MTEGGVITTITSSTPPTTTTTTTTSESSPSSSPSPPPPPPLNNDNTVAMKDDENFKQSDDGSEPSQQQQQQQVQVQLQPQPTTTITMIAKYGKERIILSNLPSTTTTIGHVKQLIQLQTRILPIRQKFIGLSTSCKTMGGTNKGVITDDLFISELVVKKTTNTKSTQSSSSSSSSSLSENENNNTTNIIHQFILMGTPEEHIFIDPSFKEDLPIILDDFDYDFDYDNPNTVGSGSGNDNEWKVQHCVTNDNNINQYTIQTSIHIMNEPRHNKPLLVLDLDHTLLDFSSKSILQQSNPSSLSSTNATTSETNVTSHMKRPYMDEFLSLCYIHYDLVIWSQTSWRWLETKLIELNMINHPSYKFCFVLDKTSMFTVDSTKGDGTKIKHYVKPLQIIWNKFPNRWGTHNTIHIDDLSRNFALNIHNGLQCTPYHRKKKKKTSSPDNNNNVATTTTTTTTSTHGRYDRELIGLCQYLIQLVQSGLIFNDVDFTQWTDVVSGTKDISTTLTKKTK